MTPNNIVNMSLLKELDMIAITDHNTCGNCKAVMEAAGDNLLVIPGIEVETSEEVHVACYFPTLDSAMLMEKAIRESMTPMKNRPEIFGNQFYFNSQDEITGEEENMLVRASGLDIYEVVNLAARLGGAAVPAHIDRSSYSVLANLGFLPPDLNVTALEITEKQRKNLLEKYPEYKILTNSDAHYLENINERYYYLELSHKTAQSVIDFLCNNHQFN